MAFDKNNSKKYILSAIMFVVGMLCVSIANIFGGYYCSVAVIETVLLTTLVYGIFDRKESLRENIVLLVLNALVAFFGIIFFVVNDIFDISVYVKNVLNFWGICVITSQALSICSIVYLASYIVFSLNKNKVELVDEHNSNKVETFSEDDELKVADEQPVVEDEKFVQKEIKSITRKNVNVDVPYMEEEK